MPESFRKVANQSPYAFVDRARKESEAIFDPFLFSRGDESTYLIKTSRDFQEFVWSALQQKSQSLKNIGEILGLQQ